MRDTMVAQFSLRARRGLWVLPAVAVLAGVFGWSCAVAAGLNDTGVTTCADASGGTVSCTVATAVQGQDARYGRDAAAGTGALTKMGGGANGFDFTKISNAGAVLASNAPLGAANGDWGCTYDNTTGLMWEVKAMSGLRAANYYYSWYDSNPATNGGVSGVSGGAPYNVLCLTAGRCDTEKYSLDVNAIGMCGHSDWRMPTLRELYGLVRIGATPAVDSVYFPGPYGRYITSASVASSLSSAWWVVFSNGGGMGSDTTVTNISSKNVGFSVMLVRVGK